jgi:preprotein translocase subunit Sec63
LASKWQKLVGAPLTKNVALVNQAGIGKEYVQNVSIEIVQLIATPSMQLLLQL